MSSATDSITRNITDICDRLLATRDPKAIAQGLKALPDVPKVAFASMYVAANLVDSDYKMIGRIQAELLKD